MLAHVHIMKTAGQTVCDILRRSFGANHCDLRCGELATMREVQFARRFYPCLKSVSGHSVRPWSDLAQIEGIRFFTFLREPVARCLSHYQFDLVRNRKSIDFLSWLDGRRNYQTKFLCGSESALQAIEMIEQRIEFVGLVEDFDASLQMLQRWVGEPLTLDYRSRNVARKRCVKDEVLSNPVYVEALQDGHQADIELYRYVVEEFYPKQLKRLGNQSANGPSAKLAPVSRVWPPLKRNVLYKPVAHAREWFRRAA